MDEYDLCVFRTVIRCFLGVRSDDGSGCHCNLGSGDRQFVQRFDTI